MNNWKLIPEGLEYSKRVLLKDEVKGEVRIGKLDRKVDDKNGIKYYFEIEVYTYRVLLQELLESGSNIIEFTPTHWQELPV